MLASTFFKVAIAPLNCLIVVLPAFTTMRIPSITEEITAASAIGRVGGQSRMIMSKFFFNESRRTLNSSLPTSSAAFEGIEPEVNTKNLGFTSCIKDLGFFLKFDIIALLVQISDTPDKPESNSKNKFS